MSNDPQWQAELDRQHGKIGNANQLTVYNPLRPQPVEQPPTNFANTNWPRPSSTSTQETANSRVSNNFGLPAGATVGGDFVEHRDVSIDEPPQSFTAAFLWGAAVGAIALLIGAWALIPLVIFRVRGHIRRLGVALLGAIVTFYTIMLVLGLGISFLKTPSQRPVAGSSASTTPSDRQSTATTPTLPRPGVNDASREVGVVESDKNAVPTVIHGVAADNSLADGSAADPSGDSGVSLTARHKHGFGRFCTGELTTSNGRLRFVSDNDKDGFDLPFGAFERPRLTERGANLELKMIGGRRFNFGAEDAKLSTDVALFAEHLIEMHAASEVPSLAEGNADSR